MVKKMMYWHLCLRILYRAKLLLRCIYVSMCRFAWEVVCSWHKGSREKCQPLLQLYLFFEGFGLVNLSWVSKQPRVSGSGLNYIALWNFELASPVEISRGIGFGIGFPVRNFNSCAGLAVGGVSV